MFDIKDKLTCKCGFNSFSIFDTVNKDIDLGDGTIGMIIDVECNSCGNITREEIEGIITKIK